MRAERWLLGLTVLAAACLMWLAPRLPMGDLPQHAGQVALWRDLLLGQSPWQDLVRINLVTPYLIGYSLMLPLSLVFSMTVTTKIVLTLGFFGFVAAAMALRREFGSDRRLDWLFVLSYFGFAWKWGFLTFLIASPLGLFVLVLAHRHAMAPSVKRAVALTLAAFVLLFSHGLVFLVIVFLSGLLAVQAAWQNRPQAVVLRLVPYALLFTATLCFRYITSRMEGAMQFSEFSYGVSPLERPGVLLSAVTDAGFFGNFILPVATAAAFAAPLLMGLKRNGLAALTVVSGFAAVLMVLPVDGFQTGLILQRQALFIPPIFAIAFRAAPELAWTGRTWLIQAMLIASCWSVLAVQATRIAAFGLESQPFETVLAAAAPGKRALGISFDLRSDAAASDTIYIIHASWYQADKHGFVDFNFAHYHPQIIRFKPGRDPGMEPGVVWSWRETDFASFDGHLYTYYFVRGSPAQVETIRRTNRCRVEVVKQDADWYLMEQFDCAAPGKG